MTKKRLQEINKELKKLHSNRVDGWGTELRNPFSINLKRVEKSDFLDTKERDLILRVQQLLHNKSQEWVEDNDSKIADLMNERILVEEKITKREEKKKEKLKNKYKNCPYNLLEKRIIKQHCGYHSHSKRYILLKKGNKYLCWVGAYTAYLQRSESLYSPPELMLVVDSGLSFDVRDRRTLWEGEESPKEGTRQNFSIELVKEYQDKINEFFEEEINLDYLSLDVTLDIGID